MNFFSQVEIAYNAGSFSVVIVPGKVYEEKDSHLSACVCVCYCVCATWTPAHCKSYSVHEREREKERLTQSGSDNACSLVVTTKKKKEFWCGFVLREKRRKKN